MKMRCHSVLLAVVGSSVVCLASLACTLKAGNDGGVDALAADDAPMLDTALPPDAMPVVGCPAKDGTGAGPTMHTGLITADETWTAAGSPHLVTESVTISGATLTIAPCADVVMSAGTDITASGTGAKLAAVGTSAMPIRFHTTDPSNWGKIYASSPGMVQLAYTSLEGGGSQLYFGATLVGEGDSSLPVTPVLDVNNVTIKGSMGLGVLVRQDGAFTADSQALTVTGSGASDMVDGYAVQIGVAAVGTLPAGGTYTGNATDAFLVEGDFVSGSFTMANLGVPYEIEDGTSIYLQDGAVMTVAPGVTIELPADQVIDVSDSSASGGSLVANGTAAQPIMFTRSESESVGRRSRSSRWERSPWPTSRSTAAAARHRRTSTTARRWCSNRPSSRRS